MLRRIPVALALLASITLSGCGGSASFKATILSPTIALVSVTCSPANLQTGQTSQCSAVVSGTGSYSSAVTWTATGGTITASGLFTPNGSGTAMVTATSTQDTTKSGTATIAINASSSIASVSVICTPASIQITQTSACSANVAGTGSFSTAVTWSASNGTMNSAGVFTPSGTGASTITATSTQDTTKSGSTTVTVNSSSSTSITTVSVICTPTSILISQTSSCTANVTGTGAFSTGVTWSATNGTVTSGGVFTPTAAGPATITATSTQDPTKLGTATVIVTTNPAITSVTVSCLPASISTTQTSTCTANVAGTGSFSTAVIWSATNGTITSAGVYTPSGTGTATITATSVQDTTKFGSATVTVNSSSSTITSVTVTCAPSSILTSQTSTCNANVTGTGSFSTAATWSVSPTTAGSVSSAGVFTPAAAGTATITATSTQDTTKFGSATVTVNGSSTITSVTVTCTPSSILTSQTSACSASVTGTGSFSTSVTWSATNGTITSAGVFTPSGAGTATITATSTQDATKFGSATVTVSGSLPTISSFTFSPSTGGSGAVITLTVTLTSAAPTGGVTISLTTTNATLFPAPGTFTVPAGQTSANQAVTAGTVTASTSVTVTATYNGSSKSVVIPFALPGMPIQHVVVIMQENRSFDNMFNGFPGADTVQTGMNKGVAVPLQVMPLAYGADPDHSHPTWWKEWDGGLMDNFGVNGTLLPYSYIAQSEVQPYWTMASSYTLGDRMFQSNTGPSFAAHQYMIAGQSEETDEDPNSSIWGCGAPSGTTVALVGPNGTDLPGIFPCFTYTTLGDLMDGKGISWTYYAPGMSSGDSGYQWSAYQAISQIYFGPDWSNNNISPETQVLTDVANGKLAQVTWVIPSFNNSDHAGAPAQGPDWVASVVNAIGQSQFWNSTAIFISWDDWGGWYDHVAPPPQVDNMGFGFRVPVIVVSPYAKRGYISHITHTSAGFLRYTEEVFGLPSLGTRDDGADDFGDCFDYTQTPIPYVPVKANHTVKFFLEQKPSGPPDDD